MIQNPDNLEGILQNMIQGSPLQKTTFLFFQTFQPADLHQNLLHILRKGAAQVFSCCLTEETHRPYHPLLDWMAEDLKDKNGRELDGLFKDAGTYQFHKPLLKQFFLKKELTRPEEPLPGELDFERKKMWANLGDILARTHNREPRVFLIGNAHLLPVSTIHLLRELFNNRPDSPMLFVFSYSLENPLKNPEDREYWDELVQLGEEEGMIFNRPMVQTSVFQSEAEDLPPAGDLDIARAARHLLAQEDALFYYNLINDKGASGRLKLREVEQAEVWEALGRLHHDRKDLDLAIGFFQSLLALAHKMSDQTLVARTLRRIAQSYLDKGNLEEAGRFAQQALKLSTELGDPLLQFYPRFILFIIEDKSRVMGIEDYRVFLTSLLDEADKLGFSNTYAFIATNPYGLYSAFSPEDQVIVEKGLQIAAKAENLLRQASAYQTMGLAFAIKGQYSKVLDMYQKSKRIKERLQDNLELAYIHNGLGSYYAMTGYYKKAHDYFENALENLKECKDYHEVGMTLFNMAANSLLAQRPALTVDFMKKSLRLLRILERRNLSYHSELGILALLGVGLILQKNTSQAWQIWMKIHMDRLTPYPEKNEEYFFLNLFQVLLTEGQLKPEEEAEYFQTAETYLTRPNDNIQYWAPFFYWEKGLFLIRRGRAVQATSEFAKGLKFAQEQENLFYINIIQSQLTGKPPILNSPLEKTDPMDIDGVIASARLSKNLVTLQQRVEDIHFLNTLQSLFYEETNRERLVSKAMEMFISTLEFKALYFHRWDNSKAQMEFSYQPQETTNKPDFQRLLELLFVEGEKKFFPSLPNLVEDYYFEFSGQPMVSLFFPIGTSLGAHVLGFLEKGTAPMRQEKIQILSLAVRQLGQALEKLEQNSTIRRQNDELKEKNFLLEKTASTDPLTGLGNRKALFAALKKESARLNRYFAEKMTPMSIVYLDLDNFKYFYENFGHSAWDVLLTKTSATLQELLRDTDHVFHFGRDEFIILLPETPSSGAVGLAQRIIGKLKEAGSFRLDLEKNLGYRLNIPVDRTLSCCVGISVLYPSKDKEFNPDLILQQASLALAQAREKGKGQIQVYTP